MGFLKPKIPKPAPAPNPAADPIDTTPSMLTDSLAPSATSLIATSAQGLKKRASTQRSSLIGGG